MFVLAGEEAKGSLLPKSDRRSNPEVGLEGAGAAGGCVGRAIGAAGALGWLWWAVG